MYKILPVKNSSAVKILCVAKIYDEVTNSYILSKNIYDNIYIDTYSCVINHVDLMASKSQPIIYGDVAFVKGITRYFLFRVYLIFTIEENVETEEKFMNDELGGSYSIKLVVNNLEKVIKLENLYFSENNEMIEKLEHFIKQPHVKQLITELIEQRKQDAEIKYSDYKLKLHNVDKLR